MCRGRPGEEKNPKDGVGRRHADPHPVRLLVNYQRPSMLCYLTRSDKTVVESAEPPIQGRNFSTLGTSQARSFVTLQSSQAVHKQLDNHDVTEHSRDTCHLLGSANIGEERRLVCQFRLIPMASLFTVILAGAISLLELLELRIYRYSLCREP